MSFIKQVKTPLLPEVKAVMDEVKIDLTTKRYKTSIKDWLSPIVNLEDFYVYPINGITEGLNLWMGTSKYKIWREIGDYEWVENSNYGMSPTTVYRSNPSSIDGNFREMIDENPVALDLAYLGTTRVEKIKIEKNIHTVFYSLSKPFGLNGIRTGWLFTRDRNDKLHNLIYKNNYYNYYATEVAEQIIKNFPIDYIYQKFLKQQIDVCQKFNLTPSDCVFLATSTDKKYKDYIRKDVARLCLTEYYA